METEYEGHASEIVRQLDVAAYDGLVIALGVLPFFQLQTAGQINCRSDNSL